MKKTHFFSVRLLLAVLLVAGMASSGLVMQSYANYFETDHKGTFTVYFNNPEGWDNVNVYFWEDGGDEGSPWPGEEMNAPGEGDIWYSYNIPDGNNMVIFNNGDGEQTEDLDRSTTGYYDGESWYDKLLKFRTCFNSLICNEPAIC